jgi:hypothetical protein
MRRQTSLDDSWTKMTKPTGGVSAAWSECKLMYGGRDVAAKSA